MTPKYYQGGGKGTASGGGMQPYDVIDAFGLNFFEGNAVKYICRWRAKGGIGDLCKAASYIQECIRRALPPGDDDDVVDATIKEGEEWSGTPYPGDPGVTLPDALKYLRTIGHLHPMEMICTQACPGYETAHFTTEAVEEAVSFVASLRRSDDAHQDEDHDDYEGNQGQVQDVHAHGPVATRDVAAQPAPRGILTADMHLTPPGGGMHEHNGYAPHSHEVRADHQGVPPKNTDWRRMSRAGLPDAASPGADVDREFCARCGNHFPAGQLCRDCAGADPAAAILAQIRGKLDKWACSYDNHHYGQAARELLAIIDPLPAREDTAEGLLSMALDLRMYGEGAPGSSITWREWDRRAETYLRTHGPVIGYRMDGDLFDPGDVEIIRRPMENE